MPILCADIGGTHTRLALAEGPKATLSHVGYHLNADFPSLFDLLTSYLTGKSAPDRACLAVAGPTDGHKAQLTNLPWAIDVQALARRFSLADARLINDFQAVGFGLDALDSTGTLTLQQGLPQPRAVRVALGPGTGLGVVQCVWNGQRHVPLASEGGHIAFAPADEEQLGLLAFLRAEFDRVSVERILSGPGIAALYRYGLSIEGRTSIEHPAPSAISRSAIEGTDPVARRAMHLFSRILGQTAGDLALLAQAQGGVYLAGGIPAKILPLLKNGELLMGFRSKGRFSTWMETVPLHVVLDPNVGLKGAALAALN